jgi:MarR family 2-MHQ and catechol resistance regulon transcriptional repressor
MLVPGANMTGIAKRLERDGFLIRKSDAKDERVTILEITPKGRRTLKNIEGKKNHSIETLLKGFSRKDKAELVDKIKQLLRNNMRLS